MKKLISVLMSALLIFAFAGCGGNEGKSSVSPSDSSASDSRNSSDSNTSSGSSQSQSSPEEDAMEYITKTQDGYEIASLDGNTTFILHTADRKLTYEVMRYDEIKFREAQLGMKINDKEYTKLCTVKGIDGKVVRGREFYVYGRQYAHIEDVVIATVHVERSNIPFDVEIRVYNDGVAFRYLFGKEAGQYVQEENTEFLLEENSKVYATFGCRNPACNNAFMGYESVCYECNYAEYDPAEKFQATNDVKKWDRIGKDEYYNYVLTPMAIAFEDGSFGAILESDIQDYVGINLRPFGGYKFGINTTAKTSDAKEGQFRAFTIAGESVTTPYRIMSFGDTLDKLYNNDIVNAVSPAPEGDFSWVTPGRSTWHWYAEKSSTGWHGSAPTYEMMMKYTETAAKLGFEYNIFDGGWKGLGQEIEGVYNDCYALAGRVAEYGKDWQVGQIAWGGYTGNELNPYSFDEKGGAQQSAKEFVDKIAEAGFVGAKVDFYQTEDSLYSGVQIYRDLLEYAAEKHLIIDNHGCNKPTGLAVQYPNELNREGIYGMENCAYTENGTNSYSKQAYVFTTMSYVRGLAGHGDWTPQIQDGIGLVEIVLTDAPFNAITATCEELLSHPAIEMIKSIPTSFDQTRVLGGSAFGKYIAMAKELDGNWWAGGISNQGKTIANSIPLDEFLGEGEYVMDLWYDSNAGLQHETRTVTAEDEVTFNLPNARGWAARFSKADYNYHGGEIVSAVEITTPIKEAEIRYTLDGSDPESSGTAAVYTGAFTPETSCRIRAVVKEKGKVAAKLDYRFNKMD